MCLPSVAVIRWNVLCVGVARCRLFWVARIHWVAWHCPNFYMAAGMALYHVNLLKDIPKAMFSCAFYQTVVGTTDSQCFLARLRLRLQLQAGPQ